jgi:hypothetical protein
LTARRVDLGSLRDPIQAGNPLLVLGVARVADGSILDLSTAQNLEYAVFRHQGDRAVGPPLFALSYAAGGIKVTSISAGRFEIEIPSSLTAMLTGRDWHVCRYIAFGGRLHDIFDGLIVSTTALSFAV